MVYRKWVSTICVRPGFGCGAYGVDEEVLAEAVRLTEYADDARLSGEGGVVVEVEVVLVVAVWRVVVMC